MPPRWTSPGDSIDVYSEHVPIHRDTNRVNLRRLDLPEGGSAEIYLEIAGNRVSQPTSYRTLTGGGSGSGGWWTRCNSHPCLGESVSPNGQCIRHCDPDDRTRYLQHAFAKRGLVSLRGVELNAQFLIDLLKRPEISDEGPNGHVVRVAASFAGSTITELVNVDGWTFTESLDFVGATFQGQTTFRAVTFKSYVGLSYIDTTATAVSFTASKFEREVDLSFAHTEPQSLGFEDCEFRGIVSGQGLYGGGLHLSRAIVARDLLMPYATGFLIMNETDLHGDLDVAHCELTGFHAKRLNARVLRTVGPLKCHSVYIQGAQFRERVKVECSTSGTGGPGWRALGARWHNRDRSTRRRP
jgi:hypothetical protein